MQLVDLAAAGQQVDQSAAGELGAGVGAARNR
jgi:hypothetical protein